MDANVVFALSVLGLLGLVFGAGLAFASLKFAVRVDPRVESIKEILPGANCGGCGHPGCPQFAEALVRGEAEPSACAPGGGEVAEAVAEILGVEAGEVVKKVAVVRCRGDAEACPDRFRYDGLPTCGAAHLVGGGPKGCVYGCLGLGSCVEVCPYEAIAMQSNGLPAVDEDSCTGCGLCVKACPRGILALVSANETVYVACVSRDKAKQVKAVCSAGCFACRMCTTPKVTPSGVIEMDGNLPKILWEKVSGVEELQPAVEKCPAGCFVVRERQPAEVA
jgi:Na+-translocating ferredoxin:NAD+ oxidoreductase RNF subunit RnfB